MSVLFIARYNGNFWNFDNMRASTTTLPAKPADQVHGGAYPEAIAAQAEAEKLFYTYTTGTGYGIVFEYVDTFYQPRMGAVGEVPASPEIPEVEAVITSGRAYLQRGYGWIAIVKDADFQAMLDALQYPNGPLCKMYDIDIIPLNNDNQSPHKPYEAIYLHMTPAHWNAS